MKGFSMATKTSRINRFSQIVRFLRVSRLLLWTIWVIYRERRRVIRARERGNYEVQPNVEVLIQVLVVFRRTAVKLGVLMIKLGQFLSSRADLLPERALEVLSSLQDEVPPAPFSHVVSVIETELGKPIEQIFSVLERKATAAASLGQVHKAVLAASGEEVAVKVQRPNIDQLVRMDLSTIRFVIWVINRFVDVNDYPALEAAGIDRLEVAKRTVQTYFYQFFEEGFFHADPHPGNIFVQKGPPGEGPVIVFVDFGMVGSLTKNMKKALKDLFLGFLSRDSHGLVNALQRLGFIGQGANMAAIERGMALMMEQYYGITMGEARDLEFPEVARDIESLLYGQPFQIPAQFAFTGRAVGTLSGLATGLAPEFNLVDVALPYAQKFLGLTAEGAGQTIQQILSQLLDTVRILLTLPGSLERVITKLETGQIEVRLAGSAQNGRSRRRGRRRDNSNGNGNAPGIGGFAWALIFAATLVGGIFLMNIHQSTPGWFCLGLAGVTVLGLLVRK